MECGHTATERTKGGPAHNHCECCDRDPVLSNTFHNFPKFGQPNPNPVCEDCFDGHKCEPVKPVSFRHVVVAASTTGTCMFCSGAATFKFNTGEFICERCV